MKCSEEERNYLKVSGEFIRFILHKKKFKASFQQHFNDVALAMSNSTYDDYVEKRDQLHQEVENNLYDLETAIGHFRGVNGSDNNTRGFVNMITFLETMRLALTKLAYNA